MTVYINGKIALNGRDAMTPLRRWSYVPVSENGERELVYVYATRVPTPEQEPSLFRGAEVHVEHSEELHLRYSDAEEMALLTTLPADDAFRIKHPELIENELIRIDFPEQ